MPSPREVRKIEEAYKAERSLYTTMLDVVKNASPPSFLKYLTKQMTKIASAQQVDAVDHADSLDVAFEKLAAKLPGDFIWFVNTCLDHPDFRKQLALAAARQSSVMAEPLAKEPHRSLELRDDGFTQLPVLLSDAQIVEMTDYLRSRENFTLDGPTRRNAIADIVQAPHALRVATDLMLLSIASDFLGGPPTIVEMDAWWSDPVDRVNYEQHIFHRDKDDFRACKFFMYLTDVGANDGPHMYVKRSHDPKFVREYLAANQLPADLIQSIFALSGGGRPFAERISEIFAPQVIEILGPAGTCFMDDSFGYHRGTPTTNKVRGILTVTYATIAYPNRLIRCAPVELERLPLGCADTALSRHAARLFLRPSV